MYIHGSKAGVSNPAEFSSKLLPKPAKLLVILNTWISSGVFK